MPLESEIMPVLHSVAATLIHGNHQSPRMSLEGFKKTTIIVKILKEM